MGADRLYLLANAQLPIAAIAVRAQYQLALVAHQHFDRRQFVFDVEIGIDADAPNELEVVLTCIGFGPDHIGFGGAGIVYQQ